MSDETKEVEVKKSSRGWPKGKPRKPRILPVPDTSEGQISVSVRFTDGREEKFRCEGWTTVGDFLRLSYWPDARGRMGTRMIQLNAISDVSIEEPLRVAPFQPAPGVTNPYPTAPVIWSNNAPPPGGWNNSGAPAYSTSTVAVGPVINANPFLAAARNIPPPTEGDGRDPLANRARRIANPNSPVPMTEIVGENGERSVVSASIS